jgi:hypothetical protein
MSIQLPLKATGVIHTKMASQPHIDRVEQEYTDYTLVPQGTQDYSRDHTVSPEDYTGDVLIEDADKVTDEADDPSNVQITSESVQNLPSEGLYPSFNLQQADPQLLLQYLGSDVIHNLLQAFQKQQAPIRTSSLGISPQQVFQSPSQPAPSSSSDISDDDEFVPQVYPDVANHSGAYVGSVSPADYDRPSPLSMDATSPRSEQSSYSAAHTNDSISTSNYSDLGINNRMSNVKVSARRPRKSRTTSPASDSTTQLGSSWENKHTHGDDVEYPCPIRSCGKTFRCASRPIAYSQELQRLIYVDTKDEVNDRDCEFLTHLFEDHEVQLSRKYVFLSFAAIC